MLIATILMCFESHFRVLKIRALQMNNSLHTFSNRILLNRSYGSVFAVACASSGLCDCLYTNNNYTLTHRVFKCDSNASFFSHSCVSIVCETTRHLALYYENHGNHNKYTDATNVHEIRLQPPERRACACASQVTHHISDTRRTPDLSTHAQHMSIAQQSRGIWLRARQVVK